MKWLLIIPMCSAFLFWGKETADSQDLLEEFGKGVQSKLSLDGEYGLVTWNVYKGDDVGMHDDLEKMIIENDFVLVQEFLLNKTQKKQVSDLNGYYWGFAKSFKDSSEWTGVATVSKWEPKSVEAFQSNDTEPLAGTPKMSLIAKYNMSNGQQLWVANIHSLNFDLSHKAFKNQLDEMILVLSTHQGPLVFGGDFNTWSDKRLEYLLAHTEELGLEKAPLKNPIGVFGKTLDHIFYRGLSSVQGTVMTSVKTSDHKPLKIQFRLNP